MRRLALSLLSCLALPVPVSAASPPATSATGEALAASESRGPLALVNLRWPAPGATLEEQARAFVAARAAAWNLGGEELGELALRAVRRGRAVDVVRLQQTVAGVPVLDSEIAVTLNRRGEVIFVASSLRPVAGDPGRLPMLAGSIAASVAGEAIGLEGVPSWQAVDLVVFPGADRSRLAWRVRLLDARGVEWRAIVDAASGDVARLEDVSYYEDANGQAFLPNPLASANATYGDPGFVDGADADTPQLVGELGPVVLRDVTFSSPNYSLLGPYASCLDWAAPAGTCPVEASIDFAYDSRSDDRNEAVNVYYHIDTFLRYANETLGIPVLPYQYVGGARYDPRGFNGADNSSYSSGTGRLQFGEGGVDDAEDTDVVIHELGHGIHDWITDGGLSQVQGLSEGLGDYFAVSYMRSFGHWTPADPEYNWVFGWDGHNPFWGGRVTNWTDTHHYPEDLVGQVHTDGQFWSSSNVDVWDAIGREATDEAVLEGISMTTGSTNQAVAAQAVIQAAAELGYGTATLAIIEGIYDATGYNVTAPTDILFFDDFERGNTSRWSSSVE